jgi:hypothetical protein
MLMYSNSKGINKNTNSNKNSNSGNNKKYDNEITIIVLVDDQHLNHSSNRIYREIIPSSLLISVTAPFYAPSMTVNMLSGINGKA